MSKPHDTAPIAIARTLANLIIAIAAVALATIIITIIHTCLFEALEDRVERLERNERITNP